MKHIKTNKRGGFGLIELFIVVAVLAIFAALLLPALAKAKQKAQRIACMNNLKQISIGYRIWAADNGDQFPALQTVAKGGWMDAGGPGTVVAGGVIGPSIGQVAASGVAYNYKLLQNELGQAPKIVACPSDERAPAASFNNGFSAQNVSYFVNPGASDTFPQSIAGGDRNLQNGWSQTTQDGLFGFSGANNTGADVVLNTSTYKTVQNLGGATASGGFVGWSAKLHSAGNTSGAGNILLGDGSGQQMSSAGFQLNWLKNAGDVGNFQSSASWTSPINVRFCFP